MEHNQQQQNENIKKEDKFEILLSTLELRLPLPSSCLRREEEGDNRADELVKTPRSSEPAAVLECPPPPRKPRSTRRLPSAKRKGRSILMTHDYLFGEMELDLELLFPSNLVGGKIVKKVKRSAE